MNSNEICIRKNQQQCLNLYDCPICLQVLLNVITLSCGHSFCQPCIRNTYFTLTRSVCPLCRAALKLHPRAFKVNVLLDQIISNEFKNNQDYMARRQNFNIHSQKKKPSVLGKIFRNILIIYNNMMILSEKMIPFFSLGMFFIILYLIKTKLLKKKIQIQTKKVHLSEEIRKILASLKKIEAADDTYGMKDVDMQSVVFSKIVKYLFTNCVRF